MSIIDTIKRMGMIQDDDYYEQQNDQDNDLPSRRSSYHSTPENAARKTTRDSNSERPRKSSSKDSYEKSTGSNAKGRTDEGNLVDMKASSEMKVVLRTPEIYHDAYQICDDLKENKTVVINFEKCNKTVSEKILCFLLGVSYAKGGQLNGISQNNYILTPYNVKIDGEFKDEMEKNGYFFG